MTLDKQDKDNFKTALFYLKGGFKDKQEISENKATESWRGKPPIPLMPSVEEYQEYLKSLGKEGDLNDRELLEKLAEQVFYNIKKYPELMEKLKEKYFTTL